jgi:RimJ/RimL family protein N-acetyltransferase
MAPDHAVTVETSGTPARISSARLTLRPWSPDDAEAALAVYGVDDVARWLSPAMGRVPDLASMRSLLAEWVAEVAGLDAPAGRWAVELADTGEVVGGIALLPLLPDGEDLEIAWQLAPRVWGRGLAAEAGHAVAHHAFGSGVEEVFAVVRQRNARGAATAQRVGMEWVGETDKYYGLRLQVYRLRKGDLDIPVQRGHGAH